jgi:histidinol dehydrogenase
MVIADDGARADFVAADLLAQAEHSPEAQALLVTNSKSLAEQVAAGAAPDAIPVARGNTARVRRQSAPHVVDSLETAFEVSPMTTRPSI